MTIMDFSALVLHEKPNQYLVCNADICPKAEAHREAPVFDMPAAALRAAWAKVVGNQPRTTLLESDDTQLADEYVQRSALFRYPDFVSVRFVDLEQGGSTVAIYSRSKYGYSDLGVNQKRIDSWLDQLAKEVEGDA
ncbi:MAG: DUF1499 domain-containing protein [Alphaproteobacteria bacterium]